MRHRWESGRSRAERHQRLQIWSSAAVFTHAPLPCRSHRTHSGRRIATGPTQPAAAVRACRRAGATPPRAVAPHCGRLRRARRACFGSVARGDDGADSDVDLLIKVPEAMGLFALGRLQQELEDVLGVAVDLVPTAGLKPDAPAAIDADLITLGPDRTSSASLMCKPRSRRSVAIWSGATCPTGSFSTQFGSVSSKSVRPSRRFRSNCSFVRLTFRGQPLPACATISHIDTLILRIQLSRTPSTMIYHSSNKQCIDSSKLPATHEAPRMIRQRGRSAVLRTLNLPH